MDDLRRQLEDLAERGEPRGAASVWEAATAAGPAGRPRAAGPRWFTPPVAIAAAVMLIAGVAAAGVISRGSGAPHITSAALPTVPGQTTSTTAVPEVAVPAKLIAESRLIQFGDCNAVAAYARQEALKRVTPYGIQEFPNAYPGGVVMSASSTGRAETAAGGPPPAADDKAASPSAPQAANATAAHSDTNVQEAGIDEPDVVKTDGKVIYALANGKLFAVDAGAPKILGSLDVGYATDMFLLGDRVLVFGGNQIYAVDSRATTSGAALAPYPGPGGNGTLRITVVDVSKPAAMKEASHLDVDGSFVSARVTDGVARVVITSRPSNMQFAYPQDQSQGAANAALEQNKSIVKAAPVDSWMAHYTFTDSAGHTGSRKVLSACDATYRPPVFSGFGLLSVLSLDPRKPADAKSTSVMADGQTVYASASRVYVASTQWVASPTPTAAPNAASPPVPSTPPNVKTLIHSFDISDPGQARYVDSGAVPGTALNQFSMSEYAGVLRVATTEQAAAQQSFVTVLADQAGKALAPVGQVGGLGKGERIYAVRFIGPLGYVVTFRQVDPLYVVDLHTPTAPKVVGQLELLGYSAYLHPVGDHLLIGVGQDATPEGRRAGTQVSLFDVSNPAAPKLLQRHAMGQGGSQAEFDHHAFLYWAPKNLTVIPINEYSGKGPGFMGAVGLTTLPSGITEVGRVSHPSGMIERSLVIGDELFTYSAGGIKTSNLSTFADKAYVQFQPDQPPQPQPDQPPGSTGGGQSTPPSPPKQ